MIPIRARGAVSAPAHSIRPPNPLPKREFRSKTINPIVGSPSEHNLRNIKHIIHEYKDNSVLKPSKIAEQFYTRGKETLLQRSLENQLDLRRKVCILEDRVQKIERILVLQNKSQINP